MDTMNIKHFEAFGPMIVEEWQLHKHESFILNRWNTFNLFEITRGINRFKGLEKMLTELINKGITIEGYPEIKQWTDTTDEFSNPSLEREIKKFPNAIGLQKALNWSNKVNSKIKTLPEVGPFENVKETLAKISLQADIAIVSSANLAAVEHEWNLYQFTPYLKGMFAQEAGTKEHCIKSLSKHYDKKNIVMLGDALGDYQAAQVNNVFFYPILADKEAMSWLSFHDHYFTKFTQQTLTETDQIQLLQAFKNNLSEEKLS
ncbi:HAD hydrolase-like protein [Macrococcus animalis]|uniref:HAD hydrolase-like protein n=1 Tax=Macrococcus animalis TaxID=3395467 RepID=UPI0039BE802B